MLAAASAGGAACPALSDTRICYGDPCPRDCVTSSFTCGTCSAACGATGQKYCTKSVLVAPANGGKACPPLTEYQTCTGAPCPSDCVVTPWQCGTCPAKCGQASSYLCTRTITRPASGGGVACPTLLSMSTPCTGPPCPVNCVVTPTWDCDPCNAECGKAGTQDCFKDIVTFPENGGLDCPPLYEERACQGAPCPPVPPPKVDCVVSAPTCSACNAQCDEMGTKSCTVKVITPASGGGKQCPPLTTTPTCFGAPCPPQVPPTDCVVSNYTCDPCFVACGKSEVVQCMRFINTPAGLKIVVSVRDEN